MELYRNFESIEGEFAVCIGFFDGVHKGHQFLLQHLQEEAKKRGLSSGVVTFANHPRQLIDPSFKFQLIDTLDQRLAKLDQMGLDACFLLTFTNEIRQMTAQQFIQQVLCQMFHVKLLIIGYDHRFGHDRSEGFDQYVTYGKACGMEVVQQPVFNDGSGLNYSSSEIRRALDAGDLHRAHQLLGWNY